MAEIHKPSPTGSGGEQTYNRRSLLVGGAAGVFATLTSGTVIDRFVHNRWIWQEADEVGKVPGLTVMWAEVKGLALPVDLNPFQGHPDVTETDRSKWQDIAVMGIGAGAARKELTDKDLRPGLVRWVLEKDNLDSPPARIASLGRLSMMTRLRAAGPSIEAAPSDQDIFAVGLRVGPGDLYATLVGLDSQNKPQFLEGALQLAQTTVGSIAAVPDPSQRIVIA